MTFETWVAIGQLVIIPVLGFMYRSISGRVIDRIARLEDRTAKNESDIERKQDREDFIRETSRTRQSIEKLLEGQARIEGMIGSDIRTAAALERLVDAKNHEGE